MPTDLKLELSEGDINNAIAVALAEAFSPEKRDALLRDLVRTILSQKASSYGKETLLSAAVHTRLVTMVQVKLEKTIDELRPEVEVLVEEALGPRFKLNVLDGVKHGLNQIVMNNIKVKVELEPKHDWDE